MTNRAPIALCSALIAASLAAAPYAQAEPAGPGSARDVVASLEHRGYRVQVITQRPVPSLDDAKVVAVQYDDENRRVDVTVR